MTYIVQRNELPELVKNKLDASNCFFEENYERFISLQGWKYLFAYDEKYVMPIGIKKNHHFFKTVCFESEPYVYNQTDEITEQDFLDKVIMELKNKKMVDFILMTPTYSLFRAYPKESKRIRFGNYVLQLENKDLMSCYSSKHRNMVRRGEKADLEIKIGKEELLDDYVSLDIATWKRSGIIANNQTRFQSSLKIMHDNTIIALAYKDGIPQCGILGYYNVNMFYYMFGATSDNPEPGATHFLHYKTMQYLQSIGVKAYNFVGCRINEDPDSKYHAIQHFKKGFGGDLEEIYMFKVICNSFKYKLFKKLVSMKNKSTKGDIIDQEYDKWKDINIMD